MFDRELALVILCQIDSSVQTILKRFRPIRSPDDFTGSDAGLEKLDAICMQLIAIGESLKNLDKVTDNSLLSHYPNIEWKRAKGLRDIITHHYFDLNAEAIYGVCEQYIEELGFAVQKIIQNLT